MEEGGSGPGLASSLELLDISWPALTDSDRDALMECLFGDAPAFPALKTLRFTRMPCVGVKYVMAPTQMNSKDETKFEPASLLRSSNPCPHIHVHSTFRAHVLRILEACLRGGITDIDLSYNGGSKEAVKAMVAEAKATIPTLGLPHDQPVKVWQQGTHGATLALKCF